MIAVLRRVICCPFLLHFLRRRTNDQSFSNSSISDYCNFVHGIGSRKRRKDVVGTSSKSSCIHSERYVVMRTMRTEFERLGLHQRLQKTKKAKKNECLTDRELEELMGVNRATYRRGKGGAFRQR